MVRDRRTSVLVLLGYCLVSFGYFGLRVAAHPGRYVIGSGTDPEIFIWSIGWWPHAVLHGENPFVSHAIWAPDGLNLAWTTSIPGIAFAVAPVTLLFGPVVGYNVAAVLLPALAAWTAFLLCRAVTGRLWPSLAGGYLFGFSSYMLGQELGHMHMSAVFLVPLVALLVLRFVRGELAARGLARRLGLVLGLQVWLSTELFFTVTLTLVAALALAYALVPDVRAAVRALPRPLAGAYALAALVASPLLAYALAGFERGTLNPPGFFSADLLNLVVPTSLVSLGGGLVARLSLQFPGNEAEQGSYLGVVILAVVVWFAAARWRRPTTRFLVAALALAVAVSLGTALWVGGHRVVPLPWDLAARLPLLDNVLPSRFALYASLAAAVIVALWASSAGPPAWLRAGVTVLAVLSLVPTLRQADWKLHPDRPEFFAHRELVDACLKPGETVLVFPFGYRGSSMLWQAEDGFRFNLAGGYLRPDTPASYGDFQAVRKALGGGANPTMDEILELARAKGVSRILSVAYYAHPSGDQLDRRAGPMQALGGVFVGPACGHPGIAG